MSEQQEPSLEEIARWMREACQERIAAGENPRVETRNRNAAFVNAAERHGVTRKRARRMLKEVF